MLVSGISQTIKSHVQRHPYPATSVLHLCDPSHRDASATQGADSRIMVLSELAVVTYFRLAVQPSY